jgi:signal transduction histidine kinase
MTIHRTRSRYLSIEHRLPVIIGALLLTVIVALSSAAYIEMRSTALGVADQRLANLNAQFRDLFGQSAAQIRTQTAAVAAKPILAEFARGQRSSERAAALGALTYAGTQPDQVIATELRDSSGRVLLSTAPGAGLERMSTQEVAPMALETADSVAVGRFRSRRDTIIYATGARVPGSAKAYVVRWRRLAGSRRTREQLTRLVGSNATFMLGNPDGTQWTNLEHAVAAPPTTPASTQRPQSYYRDPNHARYLLTVASIPGTPWQMAIDIPFASVMAPVVSFVWKMAMIAAVALALGLVAAWFLSRGLTRPIVELTAAADAIAAGDLAMRVHIDRRDEIGRLGVAFGTMAGEVRSARIDLEHKVEERTRDLNDALKKLNDAQESLVRREKLAMLGQLASGVGHELRNPLGVMTNAVYYLKTVLAKSPQNVLEYLEILQQQVTLSEKIVGDLLDFARSKAPQRQPASLEAIAQTQLARLGTTNGVRIKMEFPPSLAPVLVDQTQVGQIIFKLLTNAMQAIDGTGSIAVHAESAADRVYVDVRDTGSGVAAENAEKIFEPLFTTKARGIGLGLAVSRTLARANGGELELKPPGAGGAVFRLTLPTAPQGAS